MQNIGKIEWKRINIECVYTSSVNIILWTSVFSSGVVASNATMTGSMLFDIKPFHTLDLFLLLSCSLCIDSHNDTLNISHQMKEAVQV